MLRPYFDFDRDPLDTQVATEIRLDQDADGPAAELRGKFAARRADPAFPPERDGAPPRADGAFGDRSPGRTANPAVRQNRGDACVDRVAARNRRLPDAHAGDIRNGVEGTGRYGPYDDADIASTGPGRVCAASELVNRKNRSRQLAFTAEKLAPF